MGLFAVLVSLAATATALGFVPREPEAFRPAGATRYAANGATNPVNTSSATFVDMPNMAVSVTIPAGKVADVYINFNGVLNTCSAVYLRAVIDGNNSATPGAVQAMWDLNGGAQTHGFIWYDNVNSGAHVIKIQWYSLGGCAQAFASKRTLVVTANIY